MTAVVALDAADELFAKKPRAYTLCSALGCMNAYRFEP